MVGVAFICCTFVAKIKCHSLNYMFKPQFLYVYHDTQFEPLISYTCLSKLHMLSLLYLHLHPGPEQN